MCLRNIKGACYGASLYPVFGSLARFNGVPRVFGKASLCNTSGQRLMVEVGCFVASESVLRNRFGGFACM